MSISNISDESSCEGRDISVQEFKRSELLSFYNHLIEADLLVISNRNLHLQAIHKEFTKFSIFITRTLNKKHFLVFLMPVFQHLYLLIRSHSGKSDAERFIRYFKHLPFPPDAINSLIQCETYEELQFLINSQARIRVKLSNDAYHILMNWLRDCFSESFEMFNILRVLHENFHVDIYLDKDDEDFSAVEAEVLQSIQKCVANYDAQKTQKKSGPEVSAETCKTPQSDDDPLAQKMSELEIEAETPEMPETPITSESNSSESNFELKSSMFTMRDTARRYLEKMKHSGLDMEQIEQALLNPPDPNIAVSSVIGKDDQEMDFLEDPGPMADENAVKEIIEQLLLADPEKPFEEDSSPLEHTVSASPGDSEYLILSDASTERNDEDDTQAQDNIDDQDLNDVTSEGVKNKEHRHKTKNHFEFKQSYKSDFHSAYPITISGKDVLCSSDVSPDLLYLACGFESCKISTWRLCCSVLTLQCENDFKLQPIGTLRGHKGIVYALSIDSNRKTLISGSHDCTVRIWDIEESKCTSVISAHSAPVYAVCVSPNSRYFLSASEDKHVVLFWYDDLYPVRVYAGHSMEAINCVRFHPNCSYFASASSDGNLFLFKINYDSCPVRMFRKHIAKVYTLAFSPCGKHLASADVEGMLIIWDILTYAPIKIYETGQGIRSISYDISGSFIAALFYFKSWKVYSIEEVNAIIEAESVGVPKSVHFSTDNKMLIIQYIEADKSEIAETKEKPKTEIKMGN